MKGLQHIIARCLTSAASARERERFGAWKALGGRGSIWADTLGAWWKSPVLRPENPRLEAARSRLMLRLEERPFVSRPSVGGRLLRVAAAVAAAVFVSWSSVFVVLRAGYFDRTERMAVSTRAGQQSCVELPDGSLVWLNSETRIEFQTDKRSRRIVLDGEACFDVKHDKRHPFYVEAGGTRIRVLGTKFNVRRYAETGRVAASLLSGHIDMCVPGFDKVIDLSPGEKVVYNERDGTFTKSHLNTNHDILWQNGILIFENEPFALMAKMLERYYDVEVIYDENDFENIHFSGSINNLSIYKVLEFIDLTIPIRYTVENKTIRLELDKKHLRRGHSRR